MAVGQVKEMNDEELVKRLGETKQELFNLRFQHVTGTLENPHRLSEARRDVARVLTELREREILAAEALAAVQGEAR